MVRNSTGLQHHDVVVQAQTERLNLAVAVADAEIASIQHTPQLSSKRTHPPQHPPAAHLTHLTHQATTAYTEPAAHLSLEDRSATLGSPVDMHTHAASAHAALLEQGATADVASGTSSTAALAAAASVAAAATAVAAAARGAASPHGEAAAAAASTAVTTRSAASAAAARSAAHEAVEGWVEPGWVPPPAEPFAQDPAQGGGLICTGQGVVAADIGGLGGTIDSSQLGNLAEVMHRDVGAVRDFLSGLAGPQV